MSDRFDATSPTLAEAEERGWLRYAEKGMLADGRVEEVYRVVGIRARRSWLVLLVALVTMFSHALIAILDPEKRLSHRILGAVLFTIALLFAVLVLPSHHALIKRLGLSGPPGGRRRIDWIEMFLAVIAYLIMVIPLAWSSFG